MKPYILYVDTINKHSNCEFYLTIISHQWGSKLFAARGKTSVLTLVVCFSLCSSLRLTGHLLMKQEELQKQATFRPNLTPSAFTEIHNVLSNKHKSFSLTGVTGDGNVFHDLFFLYSLETSRLTLPIGVPAGCSLPVSTIASPCQACWPRCSVLQCPR